MAYAEHQFTLSRREEGGATARDVLAGMADRAKGARRQELLDELAGPPLPAGTHYLWVWFTDLSSTRGGGFGIAAISWVEIDAWMRVTGARPTVWEMDRIREMDRAYLRITG